MLTAAVLVVALATIATPGSSGPLESARATEDARVVMVRGGEARSDEALVLFEAGTSISERAAVHARVGAREVRDLRRGVAHVAFEGVGVETMLGRYEMQPEVLLAEPNAVRRAAYVPDDQQFDVQWGPQKIRLPEAWSLQRGHPDVVLAVFDTGLNAGHPDMKPLVHGQDLIDDDTVPEDSVGHGTLIAGIAAAQTDNGLGIAGASFDCGLAAYRVSKADGATAADTMAALNDAMDRGFHVVNMSYGSGLSVSTEAAAMQTAAQAGIVLVAASGNTGTAVPRFPAAYADVIGVANSTQNDTKAASSTFGQWSSVAAPGTGILSTNLSGGYETVGGTSAASPHVAAVAALVYAELGGERSGANAAIVRAAIESSAVPVPGDYVVHGRVDALLALFAISPPLPPVLSNADPGAVQAFFQNEITLCGSNLLSATEIQFGAEALGPADFTVVDDEHLRLAVPAPEALGTKLVTVTTAGGSASILVDVIATQPPVLVAPTLGLPGQPFTAEWAGGSGDVFFLLASPLSSTIPLFGVQVLGPQPIVAPSGTLDAVGYGSLTIPSLPSLSQGWYLQILTFGGPGVSAAMASNVAGTFFL